MSTHTLSLHERLYGVLLRLYPAEFRQEYGPLMVQAFRDMLRDARQNGDSFGLARLWLRTAFDLARSVITEHMDKRGITITVMDKIGRYEVKNLIGSGSVADIFRVHDPDSDEDRALKILKPDADPDWKFSMRRQARHLTALDHPGLPKCYEYVETEDQVYMVMDLIEGKDLLGALDESDDPLPVAEVVQWGIGVCEVLEYLHAQDPPVIARDIKPGTLMVDTTGQMVLVELEIAEEYEPDRDLPKIGTEGYSPPEQYKGRSDPRSDVYALGATLHHLITRRDPRQHEAFTFADAPPRTLNPAVPEALDAAIMKALASEGDDRYQTITEMKAALRAAV